MIVTNHKSFLLFSASSDESQTVTKFDWERKVGHSIRYQGEYQKKFQFSFYALPLSD